MSRSAVESFFRTLLLGDFEQNQNTAAQVVGGLISMIPVLDQVLDARDITGSLYRINQQGGFKNATTDQIVNFGFACFGAIPTVGSAFKTVFKPLWKQRRAAKGAVNSGLHAVESLLGLGKGGAITWIRREIIGKWPARTRDAISVANAALASCIELTEFLATASGWKDWLIPDPIQELAKQMLPGIKGLRGQLDAPLTRASNEIREFLEDLIGEQAAAVVMAIGYTAAQGSALPGSRARTGHNAAALKPQGRITPRHPDQKVKASHKTAAKRGAGPVATAVQVTRKALGKIAAQEKGLIGEHMVDYHELKRLGGDWTHDKVKSRWRPASVKKLNVDQRPVNLSLQDLPKVNQAGLDAVWEHGGQYTVTEAKASESVGAVFGFGKYKEKKGLIPIVTGLSGDQQMLHYLLTDSSDKKGTQTPLMQMGVAWTRDRGLKEGIPKSARNAITAETASRRVVLITFESTGALDHGQALVDINFGKSEAEVHPHTEHGITKQWEAAAIDAVDKARLKAHETRRSQPKPEEPAAKPTKGRKPRG